MSVPEKPLEVAEEGTEDDKQKQEQAKKLATLFPSGTKIVVKGKVVEFRISPKGDVYVVKDDLDVGPLELDDGETPVRANKFQILSYRLSYLSAYYGTVMKFLLTLISTIASIYNFTFIYSSFAQYGKNELYGILALALVKVICLLLIIRVQVQYMRVVRERTKSNTDMDYKASTKRFRAMTAILTALDIVGVFVIVANLRILGTMKAKKVFEDWQNNLTNNPSGYISGLYLALVSEALSAYGGVVKTVLLSMYNVVHQRCNRYALEYLVVHLMDVLHVTLMLCTMRLSFDYWVLGVQGIPNLPEGTFYRDLTGLLVTTYIMANHGRTFVLSLPCFMFMYALVAGAALIMFPVSIANIVVAERVRDDDLHFRYINDTLPKYARTAYYDSCVILMPCYCILVVMSCLSRDVRRRCGRSMKCCR